jgi:hypothetical protein
VAEGGTGAPDGTGDLEAELGALSRWEAQARVARAVAERRRAAWLGRQPDRGPTLAGLLVAVAERSRPVVVELLDGRRHRGSPTVVGRDMVELRTDRATVVLLALDAIGSVRVTGPEVGGSASAEAEPSAHLAGELTRLAEERPRVQTRTIGAAAPLTGTLVAAGPHLVAVRLEGGDVAYVPLAALAEVSLPESG